MMFNIEECIVVVLLPEKVISHGAILIFHKTYPTGGPKLNCDLLWTVV